MKLAFRLLQLMALPISAIGQGSDYLPGPNSGKFNDDGPLIAFEFGHIKRGDATGAPSILMSQETGTFRATNVTLKDLIVFAYRIDDFKLSGGPTWAYSTRYNIEAQAPAPNPDVHKDRAQRVMLGGMLWDLFQLDIDPVIRWHYVLEVDDSTGPLFQESSSNYEENPSLRYEETSRDQAGGFSEIQGQIIGRRTTMSALSEIMAEFEGAPVIDKTGLSGEYDFALSWTRDKSNRQHRRSTLREELGLRLRNLAVQHFVIDSAHQPVTE